MERVTVTDLKKGIDRLNRELGIASDAPGAYVLDRAYGGYKVNRRSLGGGTGECEGLGEYRMTARECYLALLAANNVAWQQVGIKRGN